MNSLTRSTRAAAPVWDGRHPLAPPCSRLAARARAPWASHASRPSQSHPRAGTVATRAVSVAQVPQVDSRASIDDIMVMYSDAFVNSQFVEHSYWVDDSMVEGELPKDLSGTLLRNGPALFEIAGRKISQPFDGDGMVAAFTFKDGKVHFRNKFVRTKAFVEEQRAGKRLYRTAFNAGPPEGQLLWNPFSAATKNTSNTNVFRWGGRTFSFSEAGRPYELDAQLNTIGETDLGGLLPSETDMCQAHFRVVSTPGGKDRLVAFGAKTKGSDAELDIWEFDERWQLLHRTPFTIPGASFGLYHDITVTPHYYVVLENPITLDLATFALRYVWGKACIAECLKFDHTKKTRIHLLPRPGAGTLLRQTVEVDGPPLFAFHHANAFEAAGGKRVVLDSFASRFVDLGLTRPTGDWYRDHSNKSRLTRFVVNTETGQAESHALSERSTEMPCILPGQGHPMRHMYIQTEIFDDSTPHYGPPQALAKLTLSDPTTCATAPFDPTTITTTAWMPGPDKIVQESVFVPRPSAAADDDGWLLALVYNSTSNTTSLAILDAQNIARGPACTVHLPHHLPIGLHGCFTPAFLGLPAEGQADPAPYDIRQGV